MDLSWIDHGFIMDLTDSLNLTRQKCDANTTSKLGLKHDSSIMEITGSPFSRI